jgi:tetratricopeptide (TPR) repeat protein
LRIALLVFVIIFVCTFETALAGQEQHREYVPVAEESIPTALGFADALFSAQDYYRAVTEYKRFVYLYPEHPEVYRVRLNVARAAIAAKRWDEARSALHHVLEQSQNRELHAQAHILLAEIPYLQGEFERSFARLEQVSDLELDPAFTLRVKGLQLWSLLEDERLEDAHVFRAAQDLDLHPDLDDIALLQEMPRKSPRLAGTLSALLPGAGQLYNGRYREAGMAFVLNAAFIAGGIQAIDTGNTVLGAILLFFEAGWYGGNIYNAVNTAHKTNRRHYRTKLEQLRERSRFSLLSTQQGAMLQLRTRF